MDEKGERDNECPAPELEVAIAGVELALAKQVELSDGRMMSPAVSVLAVRV